ncbi:MAG: hypothetical protein CMQ05_05625 [Gammaproteobacteria bacterium]|uniref:NIPSNAP domain-containing protein n=1 Tax=OM182 bacterium MED-G24 TaxID=1986255 RepID=A0A2A5WIT4_9GAMM|nr:hypothetical protein [Gammaproteobacteria bacterium]PDH36177.1 MAG: hypothetical protein CNE99_10125 [OM182 bacterium MED-G24]RPG24137.1 MAG: hypothetical protein CBC10_012190 [Gammaproteobacteria bacterium TMED50]|tara:strand:+ start:4965 stop:5315 length:351 start_codon:yes stop_codon:yes gene_type:complete
MADHIVEIRDYTIEAAWFDAYRDWAETLAAPWLRENLDVIDFWVNGGIKAEVSGSNPQVSENGQPNVCWIIRWPSKADRDENFNRIMGSESWREIWAKHPNPGAYLQMNVRFFNPT